MDAQEFEELLITLDELYSANRYLEYIELSSAAIDSAYAMALYDKAMHLLRYRCMSYFQVGIYKYPSIYLSNTASLPFCMGMISTSFNIIHLPLSTGVHLVI